MSGSRFVLVLVCSAFALGSKCWSLLFFRHKRMNAIRIRKENQVYSAEEKRALAMLNFEEKEHKEKKLMADFRKFLK